MNRPLMKTTCRKESRFDLTGQVAFITGASRGIGEAIAWAFAEAGAYVYISSRDRNACETVVEALHKAGHEACALKCHVGEIEDIRAALAAITARHGGLDVLVNNAATNPYYGHILDTDLPAFQKVMDVNVRGYFYMTTMAAKLMRENSGGSVINIASIAGVSPQPDMGLYGVSKAAVIAMTKAFASECAEFGVRVNALLPGPTKTRFASALFDNPEITAKAMERVPLKRVADPQEMAGAALFLASNASSYVTGTCIAVDGGFLAH